MILLNLGNKIKGTSTVDKHTGWIAISSIQMGVGRGITVADGGADRDTTNPSFSEITFTKDTDIASSDLFMEAICGKSLGKAEIHFIQTGGADKTQQVFLTIELEGAIITSYTANSAGERPHETLSINFTQISYQYNAFSGDKITTGTAKKWDLLSNKKL
ncbi:Hcp family type VI secretion system effector [Pseudomonas caspiana]|uniref:Hcp1 family type VI secretion system effector n=1 Tax=Pseudomonas caspiana TaxID=1451454 RepID=A0A1Y3NXW9_9PSED|nr:type VI secretion system tube protein Hcp [Pseudomonas caspiana]OUM72429.1 hypothetical protein AUC60_17800 [Pseudomonas caspiana]